jgi:beta-galactosidase
VNIINQSDSLDGYKVVVASQMYIYDEKTANNLYDFTQNGGTLILTNRSGVKDVHNNCIMLPLPTIYRELVGAYVEEYNPIGYDTVSVKFTNNETFECHQWCDILHTETAEPLAYYNQDFFKDTPAVTLNHYGKGKVYYIGTVGEKKFYHRLIRDILKDSDVSFTEGLPDNVEITVRTGDGYSVRFIFNNTNQHQSFKIRNESISLNPFEMNIDTYH